MRVFLADDSELIVERLTALVSDMDGVSMIGSASDGEAAIAEITRLCPQMVILDLQMEKGTGIDVLKAIRDLVPKPVVIVLTNYAYPPFRAACLAHGASYFLNKSTQFHEVEEIIRNHQAQQGSHTA